MTGMAKFLLGLLQVDVHLGEVSADVVVAEILLKKKMKRKESTGHVSSHNNLKLL